MLGVPADGGPDGRGGRHRGRAGPAGPARGGPRSGRPCSGSPAPGQDRHQGLPRPGARRRRPDGGDRRQPQQRAGRPADRAARHRPRPVPRRRDGARGIGHIAYLCGIARPTSAVVLNVGTAHIGEFGSREAIAPRPRASWSRRCPRTGSRCSTPTTTWCAAMAGRTGPGAHLRRGGPTWPGATSTLDDLGRTRSTLGHDGSGTTCRCARPARTRSATPPRPPRWRRRSASTWPTWPRRSPARPPLALADGGARAGRTAGRRQRRLQRQPGVDARRARRPGRDRRRRGADGRGARRDARARRAPPPAEHRGVGRRRRAPASTWSWSSATRPRRSRGAGAVHGLGTRDGDPTRRPRRGLAWVRENVAAGDVVLVKASRERRWSTWPRPLLAVDEEEGEPHEGHPVRRWLALLISLLGTRFAIILCPEGLRPGDPRRRPDQPPHQARHADHGWAGDHPLGRALGYFAAKLITQSRRRPRRCCCSSSSSGWARSASSTTSSRSPSSAASACAARPR